MGTSLLLGATLLNVGQLENGERLSGCAAWSSGGGAAEGSAPPEVGMLGA